MVLLCSSLTTWSISWRHTSLCESVRYRKLAQQAGMFASVGIIKSALIILMQGANMTTDNLDFLAEILEF